MKIPPLGHLSVFTQNSLKMYPYRNVVYCRKIPRILVSVVVLASSIQFHTVMQSLKMWQLWHYHIKWIASIAVIKKDRNDGNLS